MAWIESHQSIAQHPKTKAAARALSITKAQLIGHLHMLWWWALDYAPDGDLTGYGAADIAEAADWDGDAIVFVDALLACGRGGRSGYLDSGSEGQLLVHDWMEYAGKLVKRREVDAARKRSERQADSATGDVQGTSDGHPMDGARTNQQTNQPTEPTEPTNQPESDANAPTPALATVPVPDSVAEVFSYYQTHVKPDARLTRKAREKIKTRLKEFSVGQLKTAMDKFSVHPWYKENCADETIAWFFDTEDRIAKFVTMTPRANPNGREGDWSMPVPENRTGKKRPWEVAT